jgi:PAS domain S-box-containing protein
MSDDALREAQRRVSALEDDVRRLEGALAVQDALLTSVPDFVVQVNLAHEITFINHVAAGFDKEQVLGANLLAFADPAYHAVMRETLDRVLATGEPSGYESVGAGADGQPTDYFTRVALVRKDGVPVGFTVVATDVSAMKRTARALEERERRIELAVRAADLGFWHWDAVSDHVSWDEISCRHFGVGNEEGATTYEGFLARVHPGDRARIRAEVDASVASGHYTGLEFRSVTPAGEQRWLMTAGSVERDDDGAVTGLVGCLLDVTGRKRLEERLLQAQRMDAVGQLAAGVAHNFNNLLAAVIPALDLAVRDFPETKEILGDVREASERSAEVVRQLMAFAGGGRRAAGAGACDVGDAARRVVQLARTMIGRGITVQLSAPVEPVLVRAEPGDVEQTLMNLVLNARDALEDGGTQAAEIRVEVEVLDAEWARARVVDNGPGMSDATRRRALDPFFTTKPPGRGTGLGLSTSYATATASGGRLRLDSTPGVGTAVTLELPRAHELPSVLPKLRPQPGRGERILLVDDELAVRHVIAAALGAHGYQVRAEGDAMLALSAFERAPREVDLVLLDESMPGLGGSALLARLRAIEPGLRVIGFSGGEARMEGAQAQLQKPVSVNVLLETVRRVLDDR